MYTRNRLTLTASVHIHTDSYPLFSLSASLFRVVLSDK
jgi:hypothetical protein